MNPLDKCGKEEKLRSEKMIPYPELTKNLSGYLENPDMKRFDEKQAKKGTK